MAALWIFSLWLLLGTERALHLSRRLAVAYGILSAVVFFGANALRGSLFGQLAINKHLRKPESGESTAIKIPPFALHLVDEPLSITAGRAVLVTALILVWLASLIVIMAVLPYRLLSADLLIVSIGVIALLVLLTCLDGSWRRATERSSTKDDRLSE